MAASKATTARTKKTSSKDGVNLKVKRVTKKSSSTKSLKSKTTQGRTRTTSRKKLIMKEKQTRIEILQHLSEKTDLTKTQVESVFSELTVLIGAHLCKRGSGEITVPMTGIRIKRIDKPKTKARRMISPLTKQEVFIASKPARKAVKVVVLKVLKEMVEQ